MHLTKYNVCAYFVHLYFSILFNVLSPSTQPGFRGSATRPPPPSPQLTSHHTRGPVRLRARRSPQLAHRIWRQIASSIRARGRLTATRSLRWCWVICLVRAPPTMLPADDTVGRGIRLTLFVRPSVPSRQQTASANSLVV